MIATSINKEYCLRMAGVALVIAAMGGWFVYDGAVGYPGKNRAHERLAEKLRELREAGTFPKAAEWLKEGTNGVVFAEQFALDEAGVKLHSSTLNTVKDTQARIGQIFQREPDNAKAAQQAGVLEAALAESMARQPYSQAELNTQFGFAVFAFLFAALLLGVLARRASTRITADGAGISRNNERFEYAELTSIDWAQWHNKHIARLSFGSRSLKLDGWHHTRVDDIVALVLENRKDFTMPEKPAAKE